MDHTMTKPVFGVMLRDFPCPDLGPNIGPFPIQKMSKNFPKLCISFLIS